VSTGDYQIRPIKLDDAGPIMQWRNQQVNVLRQSVELTVHSQALYFKNVVQPQLSEPEPEQILFGFEHKGLLIGYGGLVHISWRDRRAEISFLLSQDRADVANYSEEMSAFLSLIILVARTQLQLHRLYTETYAFRGEHLAVLEFNGFAKEGTMREHVSVDGLFIDSVIHGLLLQDSPRS